MPDNTQRGVVSRNVLNDPRSTFPVIFQSLSWRESSSPAGERFSRASGPSFNELKTACIDFWAACTRRGGLAFFRLRTQARARQRSGEAFLREPDRASRGGERAGALGGSPGRGQERGDAHARSHPPR